MIGILLDILQGYCNVLYCTIYNKILILGDDTNKCILGVFIILKYLNSSSITQNEVIQNKKIRSHTCFFFTILFWF